ncbi:GcrA family cell cycle regulator [Acuticoccus mangrovi]|uniref:GcrA cell cycle regulator n=1 Tax=Acuticoccus mangrovi TaxID=2796142 RepID=A0A934IHK8_9HYPH|nr:GcrA family cell cycle regulator [Acuticoccus mangrovi]MBJ3776854.1 GcrA cell cycle regulator [Acuticoccus mangrovi]
MSWTDDRIETLRKLWADGLSASQIATALGGVSRNAVIGKIHRLGLSGRVKSPKARTPAKRAPVAPQRPAQPAPARVMAVGATAVKVVERELPAPVVLPEAEIVSLHGGVTLLELTHSCCRWPIGDPSDANFRFCGARTAAGEVYCRAHAEQAFPARARKPKENA